MELIRCDRCSKLNRVPPTAGTKRLACGNCKDDLANPAILSWLTNAAIELRSIKADYRRLDVRRYSEIERRLFRQQAVLNNLPIYSGFASTKRASFELAVEIESLIRELEVALAKRFSVDFRDVLRAVLAVVKRLVTPALSSGSRKSLPVGTVR